MQDISVFISGKWEKVTVLVTGVFFVEFGCSLCVSVFLPPNSHIEDNETIELRSHCKPYFSFRAMTPVWTGHGPDVTRIRRRTTRCHTQHAVYRSKQGEEVVNKHGGHKWERLRLHFSLDMLSNTAGLRNNPWSVAYIDMSPQALPCLFSPGDSQPPLLLCKNKRNVDLEWCKSHIKFWGGSHGCSDWGCI